MDCFTLRMYPSSRFGNLWHLLFFLQSYSLEPVTGILKFVKICSYL